MRHSAPRTVSDATLNKLCRQLVVVIRDKDTCQRCGATYAQRQIQWAHVHNRTAKSIQWQPWASLALCAECHMWADSNRELAFDVNDQLPYHLEDTVTMLAPGGGVVIVDRTGHILGHGYHGAVRSWWRTKYPDRAKLLDEWRTTPERLRPKVDREAIRADLQRQIEESGA